MLITLSALLRQDRWSGCTSCDRVRLPPQLQARFTLAESASGAIIIGDFGDQLNRAVPFPSRVEVDFLEIVLGDVIAEATLTHPREQVVAELDAGERPEFPIEVELRTEDGTVCWPARVDPAAYEDFRSSPEPELRPTEHIPRHELANAMRDVVDLQGPTPAAELFGIIRRIFGGKRVTANVEARMTAALDEAIGEGRLVRDGDLVTAP